MLKHVLFGGTVKRAVLLIASLSLAVTAFAGFKVKKIKAKKPERFQRTVTIAGVTYAADLLLDGKDQKDYFYKEITPSNFIAVRLAIFNDGKEEVVLPLNELQLLAPDGNETLLVAPETVAGVVLEEGPGAARSEPTPRTVQVGAGSTPDPRSDPSDSRNRGQYPPVTTRGTYPSGGVWGRPGVILNPGGGYGVDLSQFERQLAEKDFVDKAHTSDPVLRSMRRDRFLYFSITTKPARTKGFTLRLPVSRGIPQEVVLKF